MSFHPRIVSLEERVFPAGSYQASGSVPARDLARMGGAASGAVSRWGARMRLETLKARVREAGGPELLERLEWLDARGTRPPTAPRLVGRPDARRRPDFDVVLAGGGLSLLYAPVLAGLGLKVGVFDRARAAA